MSGSIAPQKPNALARIFGTARPLIGTVHCLPLPGAPRHGRLSMTEIVARAVRDARAYASGGMDGLILENHGDVPFLPPDAVGHEVTAALTAVAVAVRDAVDLPFGIDVLANAPINALAVARASGGRFVRVNQYVNAYVANEGFMQGEAARVLRFRQAIGAEDVAVFADVHVKHGAHAIVADRSVAEQARDVEFFDADVAIVTGNRTGDPVPDDEIAAVRSGTDLPVILGSGLDPANAPHLLALVDGAIVGSSCKRDGVWWHEVEQARVERLVRAAEGAR